MAIEYVPAAGQYRNTTTKRFVSRSDVLVAVETERNKLTRKLDEIGRAFWAKEIDLEEFQRRMASELKNSLIQGGMIGAGGQQQMTREFYGAIGQRLRTRYKNLRGFAEDILKGQMSEAQFRNRTRQYSEAYRAVFYDIETRSKRNGGFNQAKRWLDPTSEHCSDCLRLTTRGKWVPIDQVTPPGTRCQCRGRCRCFVAYRRFFDSDITRRVLQN